ncbi:MAG: hypothetical protein HYV29_14265 [Ignavibacteriales bacterium]|nr:hypothetical protein [Ignavibacteriales bacterium]
MKEDNTPRLILTADKMSGSSPMTVKFTGKFLGKIDTIQMLVPDFFLFPGHGKTLIRYALPDTTQPAKQFYTEERTYTGQGVVKLVMVLQSKYRDIYSDTLTITIN